MHLTLTSNLNSNGQLLLQITTLIFFLLSSSLLLFLPPPLLTHELTDTLLLMLSFRFALNLDAWVVAIRPLMLLDVSLKVYKLMMIHSSKSRKKKTLQSHQRQQEKFDIVVRQHLLQKFDFSINPFNYTTKSKMFSAYLKPFVYIFLG
jgi:hypothetical protein